jgi:hypothetical protein
VFGDDPNDQDGKQRQKSGNFPNGLNQADSIAIQAGHFHREIVEEGRPRLQSHRRADGEHHQVNEHGIFFDIVQNRIDPPWDVASSGGWLSITNVFPRQAGFETIWIVAVQKRANFE